MAVFIGTFENRVDRKGRVSIPAPFRQALADQSDQGIVTFPARKAPALEGCGMDFMQQQVLSKSGVDLLNSDDDSETADIFYSLKQLTFDGEGRVILPQDFRNQAGIKDQAVFVGIGELFQIWSPDRLAALQAAKRGSAS